MAWRGCSVVDITWGTPNAFRRVSDWKVAKEVETFLDYPYISMEVGPETMPAESHCGRHAEEDMGSPQTCTTA